MKSFHTAAGLGIIAAMAFSVGYVLAPSAGADERSVENVVRRTSGSVDADLRWLVVHRSNADRTPGPIVGYSRLRKDDIIDVAAILTEPVKPGETLILMVHSATDGIPAMGIEYVQGSEADRPNIQKDAS